MLLLYQAWLRLPHSRQTGLLRQGCQLPSNLIPLS